MDCFVALLLAMTAEWYEKTKRGALSAAFCVGQRLMRCRRVQRRLSEALRDGLTGQAPIHFRPAAGSWTGMCGEVLMTRVLPSE